MKKLKKTARVDGKPTNFLTLREAADELKVSIDTIRRAYRATDEGRLPVVRIGQVVRIRRVDWDRWVERSVTGGTVQPAGKAARHE
jgi:excisionase family DNA binding protein